jgi:hypothetical protein
MVIMVISGSIKKGVFTVILYYTHSQKTKICAEALGKVLNLPVTELKSPLNDKSKIKFLFHSLYLALSAKGFPVSNMPEKIEADEIYVCSPIWGGNVAAPVWYFLNHADLKNKKVNVLLTCGSPTGAEKYKKKALEALRLVDCIPGDAYAFGLGGTVPEPEVVQAHLTEMLAERNV